MKYIPAWRWNGVLGYAMRTKKINRGEKQLKTKTVGYKHHYTTLHYHEV